MTTIKKLSEVTINRIAAGEVIERPASVLKELVENSIDAGSNNIEITIEGAGKNLIKISDDGSGMGPDDLELAIQRHTTSKLDENNIMKIEYCGFRGEALPSIAAVSRLSIASSKDGKEAFLISLEGGKNIESQKIIHNKGTTITVRDLFFATPARLKFLRSDRIELNACKDIIKKISISNHVVGFKFISENKTLLDLPPNQDLESRIKALLGEDFTNNSAKISYNQNNVKITGITSLPTYNKGNAEDQFIYVNHRPVKDKILIVAVKVAYQDFIEKGRHPLICLFLNIDPREVDVNVHPAKSEVRFHDPSLIRQTIINAIKNALYESHNRVSDSLSKDLNNVLYKNTSPSNHASYRSNFSDKSRQSYSSRTNIPIHNRGDISIKSKLTDEVNIAQRQTDIATSINQDNIGNMGAAIHQIDKTYIISQTDQGIIITDQHAAHERLVYEKLKQDIAKDGVITQRLLMPEIIQLEHENHKNILEQYKDQLAKLGLTFDFIGAKSLMIRELPTIIAETNVKKLVSDIVDELIENDHTSTIDKLQEHILETYACHHSIRAGRVMNIDEMNELLRQMEATPFSGQCNHGRPTYVKLSIKDIAKILGR